MANRINFTIGYTVDKTGLQQLQNLFQTIAFQAQEPGNKMNAGLQQAGKTATQLDAILEKCFNQDLGTLNVTRFNQELKKANLTTTQIKADLAGAGATGAMAFNNLGSSILKTNIQLKQTSKLLDSMAVSMSNTVKWGITSSIFNTITGSISKSVTYAKQLDTSLNDIRIVTGKSKQEMAEFAVEANNAAKALSASTLDYTNASLIYAQQGLSDEEIKARAEVTVKAANVTGQTGEEVSEQLTAVWNGYKVTASETELYVDKLAAVAASTAANLEELSTGMSKVASAANSMGVDIDQLNAQLATIVSVTRQAPESVGTALKTIYARMSDLKVGETDEDGLDLGDVSGQMAQMGIQVLDETGNLREMGEVIEEVAEKWDRWSEAQKTAMAQVMAGKRQYNNLYALFESWDMYEDALETSRNALGTLQEQQDIYTESTAAKLKKLKATWEDLYGSLVNNDELNAGIDGLINLVQVFDNFIDSFGGGIKTIGAFGAIVSNIFNKQISNAIIHARIEQQKYQNNIQVLEAQRNAMQQSLMKTSGGQETIQSQANAIAYQKQLDLAKQIYAVRQGITSEQYNEYMQEAAIIKEETEKATLIELQMKKKLDNAGYNDKEIQNLIQELGLYDSEYQKVNDIVGMLEVQAVLSTNIKKIQQSNLSTEEKGKQIAREILGVNQNITEAYLEKYRLSTAGLTNVKDEAKLQDTISIILQNIEKWNKQDYKTTKDKSEALNFMAENMRKYSDAQSHATAGAAGLSQNIEQASKNLSIFKTIGTVLPVVSNLAMSWSSVSMVMQTLNDESVSLGDKIAQIAMTASMTIPMLIHTFTQMNNTLGYTTGLFATLSAWKEKHLILDAIGIKNSEYKIGLQATENLSQELYNKLLIKYAELHKKEVEQLTNEQKARIMVITAKKQHINLTKEQALATLEAKNEQDKLNASMLKNPATWLAMALGVLVAAISAVSAAEDAAAKKAEQAEQKRKEAVQAHIEDNKKILEQERQKQNEIDSNYELSQSYNDLVEQYELGKVSKEELDKIAQQLIDTYEIENGYLMLLAGNYETLTEKINDKIAAQQKERIESAKIEQKTAMDTLRAKATTVSNSKTSGSKLENEIISGGDYNITYAGGQTPRPTGIEKDYWYKVGSNGGLVLSRGTTYEEDVGEDIVAKRLRASGLFDETEALDIDGYSTSLKTGSFIYNYGDDAGKDMVLLYETFSEMLNDFNDPENKDYYIADPMDKTNNEYYQAILKFVNENKEAYTQYKEAVKNSAVSEGADPELLKKLSAANNFEDFKMNADLLKNELEEIIDNPEYEHYDGNIYSLMKDIFTKIDSKYSDDYMALQGFLESSNLDEENKKTLEEYFNSLDIEDISDIATLYVKGYLDENSTKEEIESQLKKLKTLLPYDTTNIELTASLRTQAINGDIDEETIKELRAYDNGAYETQLIDFENKSLKEQLEILQQISEEQQRQNAMAIADAENRRQARIEEIKAELEAKKARKEEVEWQIKNNPVIARTGALGTYQAELYNLTDDIKELQALLDEDVDFDIDIDTTALDYYTEKVESIVSYTDLLQNSTALIGKGWKIAKEDVEKFAQMYPELMYNATVLKDGSVQLNKEILQSKLGLDKQVINSDTETTATELENQIAIIDAEIAYNERKKELLVQELQNKISNSEAEKGLEDNELKYSTELNKLGVEIEKDSNVKVVNDSAITSEKVQNNLQSIILKIGQVGEAFGKMLSGEKINVADFSSIFDTETVTEDDFSKYAAENGISDEDLAAFKQKYGKDKYQKAIDDLKATEEELNSLNNLRANYTNLMSKLYANRDEAIKGIGNAVSGKGNTTEEDKDKRNEEKKKYDDEFDRYWQLNKIIDKTTESIDDLQNAQDNLFGEELQANLAKTNKLLDTQIANYQALYAEQQKEAAELRSILSQSGAAFDSAGALINYAAITEQALATYNQAVQAYNAHLIDDAAFETATTIYETFVENLERYDDLFYGEMVDTINEIEDREREKLENALSGWEAVIEVNLDEDSMARDWNDFISEMNKDFTREFENIGAELQRIATDVEYFPSTVYTDLNAINTVMQEMNNLQAGLGSTMFESVSQAEEKLRELTEQLMSDAEEMKGLYEEAWNAYLEGIDQAAEKLEKVMQEFENIDAELEYQGELIELIYGPEAYDLMDSLYKGQQKNMFAQIQSLQIQYDTWKQMYEAAEEGSADQVKYYDLMNEAQANLNDSVIEYIELLKNEYSNTVSDILKKIEKDITGGSTFDNVKEQWDRLIEKSDKYLDNLEGLYEIQSIANDTQAEIADMSDLKDQQKLQTLLDKELKQLREKDKLTKYDLDAAKARLEIAKAEIALEDARASKTSMRLTRGDDGNWSYQYIADADNVASKQQELMDAMNDYYQLAKDAHQESLESMMDLQIKLKEQLEEIANSEVLTEEEKYAKMQEVQAYYEEQMTLLAEENELYKQNLSAATAGLAWTLYNEDAINFEAMTAEEQGLIQGLETTMVTSYDNITTAATTDFATIELAVVENINSIGAAANNVATINIPAMTSAAQEMANRWSADDGTGIKATITGAIESIKTAMGQYQIKVDGVAKEVGKDFGKQGIQGAIEGATTATQTLIGKVKELCGKEVLNGLSSFKGYVDNIAKAWGSVKTKIDESTKALDSYIKKKANENKKGNTPGRGAGTTITTPSTPIPSRPAHPVTPASTQGNGVINIGDKVTLKSGGKLATNSYDTPTLSTPYAGKQLYIQNIVDTNRKAPYHLGTTKDGMNNRNTWVGWVNKDQISGYDTGGYTGEWGSTGRMAFLHEKELILNKEDTKNILAAVNGIRQFSSVESAITKGIASMIMNMAGMSVNANYNTNEAKGNQTEQVFNITAEFPNANNVSEIREAILSLPGLASQQVGLNLI